MKNNTNRTAVAAHEWYTVAGSQDLHKTTVQSRVIEQGWSESEAKSTPIGRHRGKSGMPNLASAARDANLAPCRVRYLVRSRGTTIEDAINYLKSNDN